MLAKVDADVVVGFGGYVALPAYLGARGRVPIVVHEANARAGLANRVGARFAARVAAAVPGSLPDAEILGIPLRRSVTELDRPALRAAGPGAVRAARRRPGAARLRRLAGRAHAQHGGRRRRCPGSCGAGIAVLHAHGKAGTPAAPAPGYVGLPYIDAMDLAYAAADAVLGRCGAMTVAEVSAVGLPAVYVPLPHGNGEQALNAAPVVAAGGGVLVPDAELTGDRVLAELVPLLTDPARLAAMGAAARRSGHADAAERLARLVLDVGRTPQAHQEARRRDRPLHRHRRRRDERDRPHPARPRRAGHRAPTPGTRPPCSRCGRWARRSHLGHDAGAPARCRPPRVVVSTAIRESNPELAAARERGLTVEHRATALAALTRGRRLAAVTGTAGKTSTTSMLTVALQHCGLDPSFAIGGDLAASGSGAHEGTGDIFVAEADESDASFLAFSPEVAIVTNVEADHLDHYGSPAAYVAAFDEFLGRIAPGGTLVTCVDDPGAAALADDRPRPRDPRAHLRAGRGGRRAARRVPARRARRPHRRSTSTGPSTGCGCPSPASTWRSTRWPRCWPAWRSAPRPEGLLEGLAGFDGVRRRFEFRGRAAGVAVYDDYAHHPTKVAAQLRAARDVAGAGRVVVAFQPHLYSRTREFAREFGAALGLADEVVVLDVYGAREDPEPGVSGALVAENVPLLARARALRAALGRGARGGRGHGALRRPGDHDGRGRRHGARARDPAGAVAMTRIGARPARPASGRRRRSTAAAGSRRAVVRSSCCSARWRSSCASCCTTRGLLDVQGVQVEGISTLPETDVVGAAAVPIGAPLASIDISGRREPRRAGARRRQPRWCAVAGRTRSR